MFAADVADTLLASRPRCGRTADAVNILETVIADSERQLGPQHPDTLYARGNLAASWWQAGAPPTRSQS